jgi:MFS family permease
MTAVAVPIQVYSLTHSSLAVGLVGLAVAVPLIALGLFGGAIADAVDRRTLLVVTRLLLAGVSLALTAQALLDLRQLWLLYLLTVILSALSAVSGPASRAVIPRLLPPERLAAASALSQLSFMVSVVVGPLLAGVLVASWGLQAAYAADAASFAFAIYGALRLPPMPAAPGVTRPGLRAVAEGLAFVRRQPVLTTALLVDLNTMVFGMPRALFPALAAVHFGGGPRTVGLLYASPAIGGVLGSTFSGSLSHVRRQGLAILLAATVWGAATAAFALTRLLWLAVLLLAVAGAADIVNVVLRNTIIQLNTPDELQGRVNSVGFVIGAGGPELGDVEAGTVAALTTPVISAVSGGVACVVGTVALALAFPAFARYEEKTGDT